MNSMDSIFELCYKGELYFFINNISAAEKDILQKYIKQRCETIKEELSIERLINEIQEELNLTLIPIKVDFVISV